MANKFRTDQILKNISLIKDRVPPLLANRTQNFFADSFKKQGWTDAATENWKEVNRRIPGTKEYKYPKTKQLSRRSSPILVRTGKLRRAVSNSIRSATFERIELTVGIPYASYHNEGTDNITKRQFMGDSRTLRSVQMKLLYQEFDKVWRV